MTKTQENGYTLEAAMPWSTLRVDNPAEDMTIGFDLAVNDDDDGGGTREAQFV